MLSPTPRPAATVSGFDLARFERPPALDRPVPFYSWNEKMEPAEICRQIDEMVAAGWGGVFVHSRIGLTTPYLGKEWFRAVDATIAHAKKRGIKVWLYDEDKWPSGYSGGTVPLADPAFRLQALVARPAGEASPPDCEAIGAPQAGLQMHVWTAPLGHDWFNGTCYAGLMHRQAMQRFLRDAYDPYHKRYAREFGDTIVGAFTDEPCAIFRIRLPEGAMPYTPEFLRAFQERFGYDPRPLLHLLYREGKGAERFRIHYFRVLNQLFERNFSAQLGAWCEERGVALTGHYMLEDTLYGQLTWGVMIMPNYRRQHFPGVDHLGRRADHAATMKQCQSVVNQFAKPRMLSELYGCTGGSLTFLDRHWIAASQLALGVNLLNPHLSLYTMTGCRKRDYPQNIFYQQPWWPHNRHLDDRLSRLCGALQQGRYVADTLLLHPGESAFAAWRSRLDPARFPGLLGWEMDPGAPESRRAIDAVDADFNAAIDTLLAAQRGFDLGDETILAEDGALGADAEGRPVLRVGVMSYRIVLLPTMLTLAASTLDLLDRFQSAGGVLHCVGRPPRLLEGEPSARLRRFLARLPRTPLDRLRAALDRVAPAPLDLPGLAPARRRKILAHVRDLPDGDRLVYLVNNQRLGAEFDARLLLRGAWARVDALDPADGTVAPLASSPAEGGRATALTFAPGEDRLLWLRRAPAPATVRPRGGLRSAPKTVLPLADDDWTVDRLDDNACTLDYARFRRGDGPWSEAPVPVIGLQDYLNSIHYDGPLSLEYAFEVRDFSLNRRMRLVVEYPERARITVNDRTVRANTDATWLDFRWHPIDLARHVRPGRNVIEIVYPKFQHGDRTRVEDAFARYGTEIESIYLVGDFSVRGRFLREHAVQSLWKPFGLPPITTHSLAGDDLVITDPAPLSAGDTVRQGLPFYVGRLRWRRRLPRLAGNGTWFLRASGLDCPVAEVRLDRRRLGRLALNPLEIALPADAAEGSTLAVTFFGTMRNLLGPHHHPEGELCQVGPDEFSALPPPRGGENDWIFRRARGEAVAGWVDRYSLVSFGRVRFELIRR